MVMISGNFADLLDPRFQKIRSEEQKQLPDMLPAIYAMPNHNGRNTMQWSGVGALGDWDEFTGEVNYEDPVQEYDTTMTFVEYVKGVQVERKLMDDDQFNIIDQKPRSMAASEVRTRQKHGAQMFVNAFSVDTTFSVNSEGVALCSNSHTSNNANADTSSGFDNLSTSALSATALAASRIQFVGFRDDRGNRIDCTPDEILISPDNYEVAYEIVSSMGKVDSAENNRNVHEGAYRIMEWNYLSDTNDWFLMDSMARRQMLFWVDRIEAEFAMVEDFDSLIAKWRGYMRYANAWIDWRFILGHQVS